MADKKRPDIYCLNRICSCLDGLTTDEDRRAVIQLVTDPPTPPDPILIHAAKLTNRWLERAEDPGKLLAFLQREYDPPPCSECDDEGEPCPDRIPSTGKPITTERRRTPRPE